MENLFNELLIFVETWAKPPQIVEYTRSSYDFASMISWTLNLYNNYCPYVIFWIIYY